MAAYHQDRQSRVFLLDDVKNLQAVKRAPLQPDIQDHQVRLPVPDGGERFVAVARFARGVAFIGQQAADEHANVGFVIDDEDVSRHAPP
jgi:hypothetical protein